jgi:transcriptional regulator with XRE-family HTH domain
MLRAHGGDEMLRAILGEILREERRERGLSLRELAGEAGISATYLGEVERGLKEPSFEVVEALARALELTAAEVLRRLADRLDPPQPVRALGFGAGLRAYATPAPSVHAITSQLSQEDVYAMARFGEFLLQARTEVPTRLSERGGSKAPSEPPKS